MQRKSNLFNIWIMSICLLSGCLFTSHQDFSQPAPQIIYIDSLRSKIHQLASLHKGLLGLSFEHLTTHDTFSYHGAMHFPMQSVYKFPLALWVLHLVDSGILKLDQKVYISTGVLHPHTWSPLRDKYPKGNVYVTLSELIELMMSLSDNNACDILFKLTGGPKAVQHYIQTKGIKNISIVSDVKHIQSSWAEQFKNWCTPLAMNQLLKGFCNDQYLSKANTDYLMQMMYHSPVGYKRMKAYLPSYARVAHKTGTSGTNARGITAATNDVGFIQLPDSGLMILSVFVGNSPESEAKREALIAEVGKLVWDGYVE
jgi:beta-lactamase class A